MSSIKGGPGRGDITVNSGSNEASGKSPALAAKVAAKIASGASQIVARPEDAPASGRGVYVQSNANQQVALNAADDDIILNSGGANTVFGSGSAQQSVLDDNGGLVYVTRGGSGTLVAGDGKNFIVAPSVGGGAFDISTGNGDDVILVLSGTNTISAGGGVNLIGCGNGDDFRPRQRARGT